MATNARARYRPAAQERLRCPHPTIDHSTEASALHPTYTPPSTAASTIDG